MPHVRRRLLTSGLALLAPGLGPARAFAQGHFPLRPIRLIVPFAPGGTSDVLGRLVAQRMGTFMAANIVVENRVGANGSLGADAVAKSAPDGYTLLLGFDGTLAIYPFLSRRMPFDVQKDLSPISKIADVPLLIAARPGLQADDVRGLVRLARAKPDTLTFGSAGVGSTGHLVGELLKRRAGIRMTHIPYKGGGAAMTDLMGGSVDLIIAAAPAFAPFLAGGKLKLLGVSSAQRVKSLPSVGTCAEAGLDGFDVSSWYGLLAPVGTPGQIVSQLHREVLHACRDGDTQARLEQLGAVPVANSPDEFRADIARDSARWAAVVKAAGITLDS